MFVWYRSNKRENLYHFVNASSQHSLCKQRDSRNSRSIYQPKYHKERFFPQETRMITLYLCVEIIKKQKYHTDSSYFIKTM